MVHGWDSVLPSCATRSACLLSESVLWPSSKDVCLLFGNLITLVALAGQAYSLCLSITHRGHTSYRVSGCRVGCAVDHMKFSLILIMIMMITWCQKSDADTLLVTDQCSSQLQSHKLSVCCSHAACSCVVCTHGADWCMCKVWLWRLWCCAAPALMVWAQPGASLQDHHGSHMRTVAVQWL